MRLENCFFCKYRFFIYLALGLMPTLLIFPVQHFSVIYPIYINGISL